MMDNSEGLTSNARSRITLRIEWKAVPVHLANAGERAVSGCREYLTAEIQNTKHADAAIARAIPPSSTAGVDETVWNWPLSLLSTSPPYIEEIGQVLASRRSAAPRALRELGGDYLVIGQIIPPIRRRRARPEIRREEGEDDGVERRRDEGTVREHRAGHHSRLRDRALIGTWPTASPASLRPRHDVGEFYSRGRAYYPADTRREGKEHEVRRHHKMVN